MTDSSTFRIYSSRPLPSSFREMAAEGGALLEEHNGPLPIPSAELASAAARSDGLLVTVSEHVDSRLLQRGRGGRLRVVSNVATGTDNIDLQSAAEYGIHVSRVPAAITSTPTAELALLLMLMVMRRVNEAVGDLRSGRWRSWDPYQWAGSSLTGRTLGLVGFGAIGNMVGQWGHAMGMRVQYSRRSRTTSGPSWATAVDLGALLATSDILSLHVPKSPSTTNLISTAELAQLPRGAVVINTSRGGILDETALLEALVSGHLGGAGLDVYSQEPVPTDHPLLAHPSVVALPHMGTATTATRDAMVQSALQSCLMTLRGEPIGPEASPPATKRASIQGP